MSSHAHDRSRPSSGWLVIAGFLAVLVLGYLANQGLLIAWRPIVVRAAIPSDPVRDDYFGIDSWEKDLNFVVRNIAVIEGTFSRDSWVSACLYDVQSGSVIEANAFTVGRTPNQCPSPIWQSMTITLALGDAGVSDGTMTQLGSAGHSRGGGRGGDVVHQIEGLFSETMPGRLAAGREYILYVEGDREFEVDRLMSVEEFADQNEGDFLVVTIRLDR